MNSTLLLGVVGLAGLFLVWKFLAFLIGIYNFVCAYRAISALVGVGVGSFALGHNTDFRFSDLNFTDVAGIFAKDTPKPEIRQEIREAVSKVKTVDVQKVNIPTPKAEPVDMVRISRREAMADNLGPSHGNMVMLIPSLGAAAIFVIAGLFLLKR